MRTAMRLRLLEIVACASCLSLSGCTAFTTPRISTSSFERYRAVSHLYVLGIERSNPVDDAFLTADDLIVGARKRDLFKSVDYVDNLASEPTFVLKDFSCTSNRMLCEPMLMALTLGIIPQPCGVYHVSSYTISSTGGIEICRVESGQKGTVLIGWVAGVVRYLHGWGATEDKSAYTDAVLAQILDKLAEQQCFRDINHKTPPE